MVDELPELTLVEPLPRPFDDEEWPRRLFNPEIHHPDVRKMASWVSRWTRRAILNQGPAFWLILTGHPGCGKTMTAKRACRIVRDWRMDVFPRFWSEPPTVSFADWPELAEIDDQETYDGKARDLAESQVVFLDDLGAEVDRYKAGTPKGRLKRLLASLEGKWVLFTTNVMPREYAEVWDARVASRLSAAKNFDGTKIPDYRPTKAKL